MTSYSTSRRRFLASMAATLAAGCTSEIAPTASSPSMGSDPIDTMGSDPVTTTAQAPEPIRPEAIPVPAIDLGAAAFSVGVASGAPTPDSIVLWTRLVDAEPVEIPGIWELAEDADFEALVATGEFVTKPEYNHSLHLDVSGLAPATSYYYRFLAGSMASPTGRTKTLPEAGTTPSEIRLGVSSCQHFEAGYYAAHRDLAGAGLDAFVWLGDFIYEYVLGSDLDGRAHTGVDCQTLAEYRQRYAQYRSDADLQASSAAHPWIITWDDHEVDNDYGPDINPERRAAAYQAWWENMPVRLDPPDSDGLAIYDSTQFGALVNLVVPDCRQYANAEHIIDEAQFAWLEGELSLPSRWTILASSVLVSGTGLDVDGDSLSYTWAGYPADRRRLAKVLGQQDNALVVSGDLHTAMDLDLLVGFELTEEPAAREIMAPAISSAFREDLIDLVPLLPLVSSTVNYAEARNGWLELLFTPDECLPVLHFVTDVTHADSPIELVERPPLTAT